MSSSTDLNPVLVHNSPCSRRMSGYHVKENYCDIFIHDSRENRESTAPQIGFRQGGFPHFAHEKIQNMGSPILGPFGIRNPLRLVNRLIVFRFRIRCNHRVTVMSASKVKKQSSFGPYQVVSRMDLWLLLFEFV